MHPSPNTAYGHLKQEKSNLQSTKIKSTVNDDNFPESDTPNTRTNSFCAAIEQFSFTDKAYTDLAGRFPTQSSRSNNDVYVCYSHNENAILAEPLKNRSAAEILKAWITVNNKLALAGIQPSIYILDNEISNEFKTALHKKTLNFNWFLRIYIEETQQKELFNPLKTTS